MTIKLREYSVDIVELFEDILEKHNIDIPDEDRTGDDSEARLYGMTYANLEDEVLYVLKSLVDTLKININAEIDEENL